MKKATWWIFGTGIFLILALLTLKYGDRLSFTQSSEDKFPVRDPLAIIDFDDHVSLSILQLGDTMLTDGSITRPSSGGWGRSTSSYAHIEVSDYSADDQLTGLKFKGEAGDLIVEIQLTNITDTPIDHSIYLDDGRISQQSNGGTHPSFQSAAQFLTTPADSAPEIVLQLQDRTGGWITASGPVCSDEDQLKRAAVTFQGWSRDQKMLTFRALRHGSPPKVVRIANPYYSPTPAPWATQPLPNTHTDPDFSFKLVAVKEVYVPEHGRLIVPDVEIKSRFPTQKRTWGEKEIAHRLSQCKDPTGGEHHETSIWTDRHHTERGIAFPAHAKQAILTYKFDKGSPYPRPLSDAVMVVEAVVSSDGKTLQLIHNHNPHGINKITFSLIEEKHGEQSCQLKTEGLWLNPAQKSSSAAAFSGGISECHLVAFVNSDTHSSGYSRSQGSGSSSSGGREEFHFEHKWSGPFKPGQKISFGFAPILAPTTATFTIELPTTRKVIPSPPKPTNPAGRVNSHPSP